MGTIKEWGGLSLLRVQPTDVNSLYSYFFQDLFNSASNVILIENIPEKADKNFVITNLLLSGSIATIKIKEEIYMTNAYLGGERDVNYYGTKIIGANPVLGSFELERGKYGEISYLTPFDKIPIKTDCFRGGLFPLIAFTAALLADNISSLNCAQINTRVQAVYSAENSTIAKSAELVLKDLYSGKPYKVITEELMEHLHVNPLNVSAKAGNLIDLIELQQYIRAQFWNSIGIDANYNMKRERINTAEINSNFASLKVPISTMLNTLNEGFDATNKCLGTKLHAKLNPEFKIQKVVNLQNTNLQKSISQTGDDNNANSNSTKNNDGE